MAQLLPCWTGNNCSFHIPLNRRRSAGAMEDSSKWRSMLYRNSINLGRYHRVGDKASSVQTSEVIVVAGKCLVVPNRKFNPFVFFRKKNWNRWLKNFCKVSMTLRYVRRRGARNCTRFNRANSV
ncbi:hypothetical protein AVEN_107432-1 [Araneus ventricosus]|uniref:Uncharacterized protein n=1 Tax=Araneus ventricosus TaxID=182803 RepID=A0A4Y2RZ91_ARAVE|nr:hypothetical protein AVEN_107432-1 [Araneus ventricosus]